MMLPYCKKYKTSKMEGLSKRLNEIPRRLKTFTYDNMSDSRMNLQAPAQKANKRLVAISLMTISDMLKIHKQKQIFIWK